MIIKKKLIFILLFYLLEISAMSKNNFASDAYNGIHPLVLEEIIKANLVNDIHNDLPEKAQELFRQHFNNNVNVFYVCTGTAANVLSLSAMARSHQGIICADSAHLNVDECGAPEHYMGSKLLLIPSKNGKLTVNAIREKFMNSTYQDDPYKVQPKVISITQPTEFGCVYTVKEIKEITEFAHANHMYVHMDGARLGIAAAYLNISLAALTKDVGIDVVCFGGTKMGMMMGEAVIFFNESLSRDFEAIRIQGMQRISKPQFIAAQFIALLVDNLWLKNAQHANAMASLLTSELRKIPGINISKEVQSNAVFASIDPKLISLLQQHYSFYVWNEAESEVRFMTSWETKAEDVKEFVDIIRKSLVKL